MCSMCLTAVLLEPRDFQQHKPTSSVEGFLLGIHCLMSTGQTCASSHPTRPACCWHLTEGPVRAISTVEVFLELFLHLFCSDSFILQVVMSGYFAFPLQVMVWAQFRQAGALWGIPVCERQGPL